MKKFSVFLCSLFLVFGLAGIANADLIDFTDSSVWGSAQGETSFTVGNITVSALGAAGTDRHFELAWDSTYGLGIIEVYDAGGIFDPDAQIDSKEALEVYFSTSVMTDVLTDALITRMSDDYSGKPDTNVSQYLNDKGVLDTYLGVDGEGKPVATPNVSRVNFDVDALATVYDTSIDVALPTLKGDPIELDRVIFQSTDGRYGDGFMLAGFEGEGDFGLDSSAGAPVPEPATMLLLGSGLVGLAAVGRRKFFRK